MARTKSNKPIKIHAGFNILKKDKDKAQELADKQGISLSLYINKAVIEKIRRDEEG